MPLLARGGGGGGGGANGGGSLVSKVVGVATHSLELQQRRDTALSAVCVARMSLGFFLLFQPLVLLGLRDEPVGRATAQLFFSSQFYARLAGLLVAKKDFFSTPRRLRGRLAKRGAQLACLFASFCTAQWVGYGLSADVASPLRRTLPLGLALGVVVARTATSLFDYANGQVGGWVGGCGGRGEARVLLQPIPVLFILPSFLASVLNSLSNDRCGSSYGSSGRSERCSRRRTGTSYWTSRRPYPRSWRCSTPNRRRSTKRQTRREG